MTDTHTKQANRTTQFPRARALRVLATFGAGCLAFFLSRYLIPNLAFQSLAAVAAAVIVGDSVFIKSFYARVFSLEFLKLNKRTETHWLLRSSQVLFCVAIGLFLIGALFHPVTWRDFYNTGPIVIGSFVTALVLPSIFRFAQRAGALFDAVSKSFRVAVLACLLALASTIQILLGHAIQFIPEWDAGTVFKNAAGLATGTQTTLDEDYFSMYPNNVMLALLLRSYLSLMHSWNVADLYLSAIVLNSMALTLSLLLTFLVARRIAGSSMAVFTLVPAFAYIVLSPWVSIPYSDTLGMVFPILILYLFLVSRTAKAPAAKLGLWAAMGVSAAVGFNIKPTIVFVLGAAVVVAFLTSNVKRFGLKRLVLTVVSAAVAFSMFFGGGIVITALESNSGVLSFDINHDDKAFPATHFLKMGATGDGGFNQDDVIVSRSITSPSERFQNGLDVYFQRVGAMGPWNYSNFLFTKGKAIIGDGAFSVWGEGMSAGPVNFEATDGLSVKIRDYFYFESPNFTFVKGFWQSGWFVILALVAIPAFVRGRNLFGSAGSVMRLSLLALVAFLLLFEGRSRYLYMYMPFFILLASMTLATISQKATAVAAQFRPGAATSDR